MTNQARLSDARIAAAVAGPEDQVVTLPEGPTVLVYDRATDRVERFDNPGHVAEDWRRPRATALLIEQKVDIVCSVPQTFCSISQQAVVEAGIRFFQVDPGTPFQEVVIQARAGALESRATLPESELF